MATVQLTHDGRVARVVLARPPLNVIDLGYAGELCTALEEARASAAAVLVLEARGRAFSAGVDVRDHLPDRGAEMLREFHRACRLLHEAEIPVIAAVQGAALGGGCELTLVCDLVVAAASATFGLPEIRLGVFPPLASVFLPARVPGHVAAEMLLSGRILGAAEARAVGLVNRIAADHELDAALEAMIAELLALSPASLRLAKQAMAIGRPQPGREQVEAAERLYVERLMRTPDAVEGLEAFLAKRPPRWRS